MSRRKSNYPTVAEITPAAPVQNTPHEPVGSPPVASGDAPATPVAADDPMPSVAFPVAFERSLLMVLKHEGGFVDHPRDPGGATNLGISLRYARTRGSLFDVDGDGDVDADDIRLLRPEDAAPAYHEDFWLKVRAAELPPGVDHAVFDAAVNSGPRRAIEWLQAAVGARVDGVIGPQTLAATAKAVERDGVDVAVVNLATHRMVFLRGLPAWGTFGRGWERRVNLVVQEAHQIARGRA